MKEIDTILSKYIKEIKAPSVQYVFFNRDTITYSFQCGLADIKNQRKIKENDTYNAYSVTKTFTALAILQLAEQEKLDIEHPIKDYLPEFQYPAEITIKQLMSHSAGIPNPIPLSWIHLVEEHQSFNANVFFEKIFAKNKKTKSRPNEKFAYSNLGYVLLGQLIEKISGISYEDYIREHILRPLGNDKTDLDFTISNTDQHVKGYLKKFSFLNVVLGFIMNKSKFLNSISEGKWISFKDNYVNGASYGGLIGTSNSLVSYIQELLKPNCKLITDNYKKILFSENYTTRKKGTGMCLSWFKGQLNGHQYFTHAGGGGGYYCEIRIYPEKGKGSVLLFNRTGIRDERFLDKLDKYFINE
jgi:CubicO group peptidase (beta-lactamase class C family)